MRPEDRSRLQLAAAIAALANATLLLLLQFVLTPTRQAPVFLFVPFTGLWVFGAAMLLLAPRFGAAGTTAWGLLAAFGSVRSHRTFAGEDAAILLFSLAGAATALAYLVQLYRRRA